MTASNKSWLVHDKQRLFLAMTEHLAGNAHISFEGDFRHLKLLRISGASSEETALLRRNTLWPKQDFVVVPLEPTTNRIILSAIGGALPRSILHVQIEKAGVLEFSAYDNFGPGCIYFGNAVDRQVLESLAGEGVLNHMAERPNKSSTL